MDRTEAIGDGRSEGALTRRLQSQLKGLAADLTLDEHILQEVLAKGVRVDERIGTVTPNTSSREFRLLEPLAPLGLDREPPIARPRSRLLRSSPFVPPS